MKIILTYKNYQTNKKEYQARIIYDNNKEKKDIENIIKNFNETIISIFKTNNIINYIDITKEYLPKLIELLLTINNTTIVAGTQNFNKDNTNNIEDIIDSTHLNITLKKGKYLNYQNIYYVIFKYANDEQREEVAYDFNCNLNGLIGQNPNTINTDHLLPFIIDRNGNITLENTGIIGGTNIPEHTLPFFIKRFLNGYNAILTINNIKFKRTTDNKHLLQTISSLNKEKIKRKSR